MVKVGCSIKKDESAHASRRTGRAVQKRKGRERMKKKDGR